MATRTKKSRKKNTIPIYYSPAYIAAGHSFDTTRKSGWIADSLQAEPIGGLELVAPLPLTAAQIGEVHDPSYVQAIETGTPRAAAESQGFTWDAGLWPMVLASNGGAVAAALAALEGGTAGSLSSGLHHARYDRGVGACTFNGLVLAARAALAAGARKVLILDLDAHCGGGTVSLIADEPRILQLDLSVNDFDIYPTTPQHTVEVIKRSADYLPTLRSRLAELDQRGEAFDLCLYNAGMDPCEDCDTGSLPGVNRALLGEREQLVFEWCRRNRLPLAFVLAGGYTGPRLDQQRLVALHRLTLDAAALPGTN